VWWLISFGIYTAGFIFAFIVSGGGAGPADMPLTLLRSAVWPLYLTTGIPHGYRYPMD
jgi:hypothetical protein